MILGIDTSLGTSVALADDDGVILAEADSPDPRGHAEVIGNLLEQVLAEASCAPRDVTYAAVGMGPGPFTGLRVGIAAARAFALGRGIPVVPVVSHDAAALGITLADPFADLDRFAVVTDARRRELAYSVYDGVGADGIPLRIAGPALAATADLADVLAAVGAHRRDAGRIPAAMVALLAACAIAADREVGPPDALYLRAPDVTVPAPRR